MASHYAKTTRMVFTIFFKFHRFKEETFRDQDATENTFKEFGFQKQQNILLVGRNVFMFMVLVLVKYNC
jgi:hypothetical protein